ncbi:unnamed protein product [Boreogadus saida]
MQELKHHRCIFIFFLSLSLFLLGAQTHDAVGSPPYFTVPHSNLEHNGKGVMANKTILSLWDVVGRLNPQTLLSLSLSLCVRFHPDAHNSLLNMTYDFTSQPS